METQRFVDTRGSVLLVDDDELSRAVLSVLLKGKGYQVRCAASGDEALVALSSGLQEGLPGIILSDLQMPGLAGNAFAGRLRDLYGSSMRLLAMSAADPEPPAIDQYDGFLSKPLCLEAFDRAVEGDSATPKAPLSSPLASRVLDEATYRKFASAMRKEQIANLYGFCIADALDRIELMRACALRADTEGLRSHAHTLRGGCGMVGAMEIRDLAANLEDVGVGERTSLELDALTRDLAAACERLRSMLEVRWRDGA